jgi:hypothetical protein
VSGIEHVLDDAFRRSPDLPIFEIPVGWGVAVTSFIENVNHSRVGAAKKFGVADCIREMSYLKHQRRLFELVAVLGRSERSDGGMLIHAVDEHSSFRQNNRYRAQPPRQYPSDSVTTSVHKDSIPRSW